MTQTTPQDSTIYQRGTKTIKLRTYLLAPGSMVLVDETNDRALRPTGSKWRTVEWIDYPDSQRVALKFEGVEAMHFDRRQTRWIVLDESIEA